MGPQSHYALTYRLVDHRPRGWCVTVSHGAFPSLHGPGDALRADLERVDRTAISFPMPSAVRPARHVHHGFSSHFPWSRVPAHRDPPGDGREPRNRLLPVRVGFHAVGPRSACGSPHTQPTPGL